jgi:hypothetical protein
MENRFSFRYDPETGIFFKVHYGRTSIQEITASWLKAIRERLIPPEVRGFVLDYRQASFDLPDQAYLKVPEFYREHLEVFGGFRIAIITVNPEDVVYPYLIAERDEGYESKPFSTEEAAIAWVLSKERSQE